MNHAASNVLHILTQNAPLHRASANTKRSSSAARQHCAKPIHRPSFPADEDVFKSIDTSCFCA